MKKKLTYIIPITALCVALFTVIALIFVIILQTQAQAPTPEPTVEIDPPTATAVNRVILSGDELHASAFVKDIISEAEVHTRFVRRPDFTLPGSRGVEIMLFDLTGNQVVIGAELTVIGLTPVTLEAGSPRELSPRDFVRDELQGLYFETDINAIDFNRADEYDILIIWMDSVGVTTLNIIDTTPPEAEPVAVEGWIGDDFGPMDFVTDIVDYSDVTAAFSREPGFAPDFTVEGTQEIKIILTDASGNSAEIVTALSLKRDTEPPVISGDIHKAVFLGDAVAYRRGVTVTDNRDESVELVVDSSAVNVHVAGVYPVYFSAADRAGNHTRVAGSLTVLDVDEARVFEMADEILDRILNEDMTLQQKARRIFDWIRGSIGYVNTNDPNELLPSAYRAMSRRSGDCFTFFAISQLLLERAGIPSIPVERVGGRSRHYWQIIDVGAGWHHFDSTPWHVPVDTFMMTESRAQELARIYQNRGYYEYDRSLHPEVTP